MKTFKLTSSIDSSWKSIFIATVLIGTGVVETLRAQEETNASEPLGTPEVVGERQSFTAVQEVYGHLLLRFDKEGFNGSLELCCTSTTTATGAYLTWRLESQPQNNTESLSATIEANALPGVSQRLFFSSRWPTEERFTRDLRLTIDGELEKQIPLQALDVTIVSEDRIRLDYVLPGTSEKRYRTTPAPGIERINLHFGKRQRLDLLLGIDQRELRKFVGAGGFINALSQFLRQPPIQTFLSILTALVLLLLTRIIQRFFDLYEATGHETQVMRRKVEEIESANWEAEKRLELINYLKDLRLRPEYRGFGKALQEPIEILIDAGPTDEQALYIALKDLTPKVNLAWVVYKT